MTILFRFPSQRITTEIDKSVGRLQPGDRDLYEMTVAPIVEVCTKYRQGVRGMLKSQVEHLLHKYLDVELEFQVSSSRKLPHNIIF